MPEKIKKLHFDWTNLDPEAWRGPGLSFPLAADLVMVPEFDELVIAAVDAFSEFTLVENTEISYIVLNEWERGDEAPQPFGSLGASDLGLRLHYVEGDYREYVLKLRDSDEPKDFGYHA